MSGSRALKQSANKTGSSGFGSQLGRELVDQALAASTGRGWVSPELLHQLFQSSGDASVQTTPGQSSLDQLLAEQQSRKKSVKLAATLQAIENSNTTVGT